MEKKSLRLLITEDCNLSCEYCCNKLKESEAKFQYISFSDAGKIIPMYNALCISGGEPLLNKGAVHNFLLLAQHYDIPTYLYTNGLLITYSDVDFMLKEFTGINIGIHNENQQEYFLKYVPELLTLDNVKFCVQDIKVSKYANLLHKDKLKLWKMDDCFNNVDTEDWFIIK